MTNIFKKCLADLPKNILSNKVYSSTRTPPTLLIVMRDGSKYFQTQSKKRLLHLSKAHLNWISLWCKIYCSNFWSWHHPKRVLHRALKSNSHIRFCNWLLTKQGITVFRSWRVQKMLSKPFLQQNFGYFRVLWKILWVKNVRLFIKQCNAGGPRFESQHF